MHIGFSLVFHGIILNKVVSEKFAFLISMPMVLSLFGRLVAWGGSNRQTDRRTHTHRPSTVTLAPRVNYVIGMFHGLLTILLSLQVKVTVSLGQA